MNYLSLFSGIGGFELGIGKHGQCVGYSEINPYALQIYEHHFPTHKNFGDITKIDPEALPAFDLLVAGFPCQSFSTAGSRKGFNDSRGSLFFEIARLIRHTKPPYLLLENVKGLVYHDKGRTFTTILHTLDELGYDCQWQVLNSKNFGVPQNRQRVFIIGCLRGQPRPQVFPLKPRRSKPHKPKRIFSFPSVAIREPNRNGYSIAKYGDGIDVGYPKSKHRCGRVSKGLSHTLMTRADICTITKEGSLRRFTPLEAERIQGFPDGWTHYGDRGNSKVSMSDTQRYKCLGNAVSAGVIQEIIQKLIKFKA